MSCKKDAAISVWWFELWSDLWEDALIMEKISEKYKIIYNYEEAWYVETSWRRFDTFPKVTKNLLNKFKRIKRTLNPELWRERKLKFEDYR